MKKVMIVLLALAMAAAGLFFWKGGHHAMAMADLLEEWLDADNADQVLTVQVATPGFKTDSDTGRIEPQVRQWSLTADTFWTEYADDQVFGLTAADAAVYLRDGTLYADTGRAYSLPDLSGKLRELCIGLLLYGRVTKTTDTYHIAMDREDLELHISVTADRAIQAISVMAVLPDDTAVRVSVTPKTPLSHPIPQPVADAMVRAMMEPPISIREPLEVLLPALDALLPLNGDLELGVSCGILELSETVQLTADGKKAAITRDGVTIELALPGDLSPAAAALLLLRDGEFTRMEDGAELSLDLSGASTTALLEALVPQATGLGITMDGSTLTLRITQGQLTGAFMAAEGSVPFLLTTIPVTFRAELTVS